MNTIYFVPTPKHGEPSRHSVLSWIFLIFNARLFTAKFNIKNFFSEKFIMTRLSCIEVLRPETSHLSILNSGRSGPKKHCYEKYVILRCGWSAPPTLQITVIWDPCRWVTKQMLTIDDLVHCCAHLYLFTSVLYCLPRPVCLLFPSHVFSKAAFQHCASFCLSGKSLNSCPACMFACVYTRIFVWMCVWGWGWRRNRSSQRDALCWRETLTLPSWLASGWGIVVNAHQVTPGSELS